MKSLIIVESPAKAKTIEKFLGSRYQVKASRGHVRDLPKSQLGVDLDQRFAPKYQIIPSQRTTIKDLKAALGAADQVYLATDPDREGEAISWHLAHALGLDLTSPLRIVFREITADAIRKAVEEPRPIDLALVDAQQARRVLDRLVGYQLSPLLWRKVRRGLSAGRVQSVAVGLIVGRERERQAFVSQEYWTVSATFLTAAEASLSAELATVGGEKPDLGSQQSVAAILSLVQMDQPFLVAAVSEKKRRRLAPPPFTTSTLQQEASRKLGFSVRRTMSVAQTLYEGVDLSGGERVGLITYMRTDATRVADEAKAQAHQYIRQHFSEAYDHPVDRRVKAKPGVQDAHEAIRPTSLERTPDQVQSHLNRDQLRLYRLIWERFLASRMSPADLKATAVDIAQDQVVFRATGSVVLFDGFLRVTNIPDDDEELRTMPAVAVGDPLTIGEMTPDQHFTEPPARYTEASLVKVLEEKGIGRPSTYAPIIDTIQQRGYVELVERRFAPTVLGEVVVDLLAAHFPEVVDPAFTADLERRLDRIEDGKQVWQDVVGSFYEDFSARLKTADKDMARVKMPVEPTDQICELCGKPMVIRQGRFGPFLSCSGFPECKNAKPLAKGTGVTCPVCHQGEVVERKAKRRQRVFYGCSRYPACDFTSPLKPVNRICPQCAAPYLVERRHGGQVTVSCRAPGCSFQEEVVVAASHDQ
ncbi:MAG: type I DNA topoisomerase [Sulfobacillus sp.]